MLCSAFIPDPLRSGGVALLGQQQLGDDGTVVLGLQAESAADRLVFRGAIARLRVLGFEQQQESLARRRHVPSVQGTTDIAARTQPWTSAPTVSNEIDSDVHAVTSASFTNSDSFDPGG